MSEPLKRKPLLSAEAINGLCSAKQQILDGAVGKMPERLVLATVAAAVRLAGREARPGEVLSDRVIELVRESLQAIAQHKWKPETALLLKKRRASRDA